MLPTYLLSTGLFVSGTKSSPILGDLRRPFSVMEYWARSLKMLASFGDPRIKILAQKSGVHYLPT